ncbi:hypothetical protein [Alloactinosynnema sp. L-07]|nr:hypothetical protein [Alloactinosynnema sp. L-07]
MAWWRRHARHLLGRWCLRTLGCAVTTGAQHRPRPRLTTVDRAGRGALARSRSLRVSYRTTRNHHLIASCEFTGVTHSRRHRWPFTPRYQDTGHSRHCDGCSPPRPRRDPRSFWGNRFWQAPPSWA